MPHPHKKQKTMWTNLNLPLGESVDSRLKRDVANGVLGYSCDRAGSAKEYKCSMHSASGCRYRLKVVNDPYSEDPATKKIVETGLHNCDDWRNYKVPKKGLIALFRKYAHNLWNADPAMAPDVVQNKMISFFNCPTALAKKKKIRSCKDYWLKNNSGRVKEMSRAALLEWSADHTYEKVMEAEDTTADPRAERFFALEFVGNVVVDDDVLGESRLTLVLSTPTLLRNFIRDGATCFPLDATHKVVVSRFPLMAMGVQDSALHFHHGVWNLSSHEDATAFYHLLQATDMACQRLEGKRAACVKLLNNPSNLDLFVLDVKTMHDTLASKAEAVHSLGLLVARWTPLEKAFIEGFVAEYGTDWKANWMHGHFGAGVPTNNNGCERGFRTQKAVTVPDHSLPIGEFLTRFSVFARCCSDDERTKGFFAETPFGTRDTTMAHKRWVAAMLWLQDTMPDLPFFSGTFGRDWREIRHAVREKRVLEVKAKLDAVIASNAAATAVLVANSKQHVTNINHGLLTSMEDHRETLRCLDANMDTTRELGAYVELFEVAIADLKDIEETDVDGAVEPVVPDFSVLPLDERVLCDGIIIPSRAYRDSTKYKDALAFRDTVESLEKEVERVNRGPCHIEKALQEYKEYDYQNLPEGETLKSFLRKRGRFYTLHRADTKAGWSCTCPYYLHYAICKHSTAFSLHEGLISHPPSVLKDGKPFKRGRGRPRKSSPALVHGGNPMPLA